MNLPLIFDFTEEIFSTSNEFGVAVRVQGKAVALDDGDGDFSIYGLVPAGPSGGGHDLSSAWRDYRASFRETLEDLMSRAEGVEAFRREFDELFSQAAPHLLEEWDRAVARVQAGESEHADLPTRKDYSHRSVEIVELSLRASSPDGGSFAVAA